jgi:hypothetical protein
MFEVTERSSALDAMAKEAEERLRRALDAT